MQETKSVIRTRILGLLRNQKEDERTKKSRQVCQRLFSRPEFQRARVILFYAPFDGEVETLEMMREAQKLGKKIVLPITLKDQRKLIPLIVENLTEELETGPYGIKQPREGCCPPVDLHEIDLAIVPGVAFDKKNRRLGRGAGYYDRFLSEFPSEAPTIGLAFDFQLLDELPHQEHDIPVSLVLTN